MSKSPVGKVSSPKETRKILEILEGIGRILQPLTLKRLTDCFPDRIRSDKEKVTRPLLLVALLDQQAESPTALKMAQRVYKTFGEELFSRPARALVNLDRLGAFQDEYKISPAIGRVLPRFAWILLRVGAFLIYELTLDNDGKRLSDELSKCASPVEASDLLEGNIVLNAVLREKARLMFLSWVGHPGLGIDISRGKWRENEFLMPVDGHVGKVFCRSGVINEVVREGKPHRGARWNIIQASNMRPSIQAVVQEHHKDCIYVDHGAFQIGFNCCPDNLTGIACDSCQNISCEIAEVISCGGQCPLSGYCKRNTMWRAY